MILGRQRYLKIILKGLIINTKKIIGKLIHAKIKNVCSSKVTPDKRMARWSTSL